MAKVLSEIDTPIGLTNLLSRHIARKYIYICYGWKTYSVRKIVIKKREIREGEKMIKSDGYLIWQ